VVPRHVGKPLRTRPKSDKTDCYNKTNKTQNHKTLPRPSANTRDRAPHGVLCPLLRTLQKRCASRLRFDEDTGRYWTLQVARITENGR
jgi:hypothetical protein